jgi:hypothetical protein
MKCSLELLSLLQNSRFLHSRGAPRGRRVTYEIAASFYGGQLRWSAVFKAARNYKHVTPLE